jgi:methylated-DNA-protein-cysteine methyltransferase-like protein
MNVKALSSRHGLGYEQVNVEQAKRSLRRNALRSNEHRDIAFRHMILAIPTGKVSTYGKVAAAAGYPRYHRAVARLLRVDPVDQLPWHRVLGVGGEIKLPGDAALEQLARLKLEGVQFDAKRVDMERFKHTFKPGKSMDRLWVPRCAERGSRAPRPSSRK